MSECNSLNLEIIKQRDAARLKIVDLNRIIRNLEVDKRNLEEHCTELCNKIHELENWRLYELKNVKLQKNGENMNKKPFVSTVRSGSIFPNPSRIAEPSSAIRCSKCLCDAIAKGDIWHVEMQRLRNDVLTEKELVAACQKQVIFTRLVYNQIFP